MIKKVTFSLNYYYYISIDAIKLCLHTLTVHLYTLLLASEVPWPINVAIPLVNTSWQLILSFLPS